MYGMGKQSSNKLQTWIKQIANGANDTNCELMEINVIALKIISKIQIWAID